MAGSKPYIDPSTGKVYVYDPKLGWQNVPTDKPLTPGEIAGINGGTMYIDPATGQVVPYPPPTDLPGGEVPPDTVPGTYTPPPELPPGWGNHPPPDTTPPPDEPPPDGTPDPPPIDSTTGTPTSYLEVLRRLGAM